MLEERARKEREDMKRQLLLGVEFGGGGKDDLRIMMAARKGACASCLLRL
jgi:hypothetical protein